MYQQSEGERIKQLRSNMLVHSFIYYKMGTSIISDDTWQDLAEELVYLQTKDDYPKIGWYDDEFKDWNGTTGFHLPQDPWVTHKAFQLLGWNNKHEGAVK